MKAIYPGTFDPFSLGHMDLATRAAKIYSEVLIAVSENKRKNPLFTFEERIEMVKIALADTPNIKVTGFSGLLVDLMKKHNILHVVRGTRGMVDFEYEFQMAQINRVLLQDYETIFLMPSEKFMVLNSTFIREVALHGGNIDDFVHPDVAEYIKPILRKKYE